MDVFLKWIWATLITSSSILSWVIPTEDKLIFIHIMVLDAAAATVVDTSAASFFAWMGCASALVFANLGAAYGTARSGVGLCSMGVMSPGLVMKNIIPIVMAGILGIYGLIVAVIIQGSGEYRCHSV